MDNPASGERPDRPAKRDPIARQRRLMEAARDEFTAKGLEGARVDEIARRAGVNKQLVYHYFGNKDGLYLKVLENTYEAMIEAKSSLNLDSVPPLEAVERLVGFTFDHLVHHPEFVAMLNDENVHKARYLRNSRKVPTMHARLVGLIDGILRRGERDGSLRKGIDTVQFYITLSGMCYFYFANIHTLSVVFNRDLSAPAALAARRVHIVETVMASVRP